MYFKVKSSLKWSTFVAFICWIIQHTCACNTCSSPIITSIKYTIIKWPWHGQRNLMKSNNYNWDSKFSHKYQLFAMIFSSQKSYLWMSRFETLHPLTIGNAVRWTELYLVIWSDSCIKAWQLISVKAVDFVHQKRLFYEIYLEWISIFNQTEYKNSGISS